MHLKGFAHQIQKPFAKKLRMRCEMKLLRDLYLQGISKDTRKKRTSPKSDKLSLSKQKSQLIGVSIEGNQISHSEKPNFDSKTAEMEKQQDDQSPSAGKVTPAAVVDESSYNQLKTNTKSFTVDDFVPSVPSYKQTRQECSSCLKLQDEVIQLREAVRRRSIPTADQIPATILGCRIPKEKYEIVRDAMDKSKSAIFVECNESKEFVRAEPDMYQ